MGLHSELSFTLTMQKMQTFVTCLDINGTRFFKHKCQDRGSPSGLVRKNTDRETRHLDSRPSSACTAD